jgi:hypothetical protein
MHLESGSTATEPRQTLLLAKVVQPVFIVQGAHFRIERKLASPAVCDFHESNIDWIVTKMASYAKAERSTKDKKAKDRVKQNFNACLVFFRVLNALTAAVIGRDALKM